MPPRKISNRMAFGSYHVTPPPVRRAPAPAAQPAPPQLETKEHEAAPLRPDNVADLSDGAAPYNLTAAEPYVEPIEPFAAQFAGLVIRVPPSVRMQLAERLERRHYALDSTEPEVRAILAKAVETYEKKKRSGAAAAAARRAKVREAKAGEAGEAPKPRRPRGPAPLPAKKPERFGVSPTSLDLVGGIGEDEADEGDEGDESEG